MKKLFLTIGILAALLFPAFAEMGHKTATQCAMIDNFDLCFDIMPHKDYQKMMKGMKMEPMKAAADTTHHVAVTIRKDGIKIKDASANLKAVSPDGREESRVLSYNPDMMSQHVGHFNMPKKGKYQLVITFESGKEKHRGGIFYDVK